MEDATLSRRERERRERRRAMLEAARAVFAERGYANATLDEVAQRAEFGKGTLYNYFPDGKEEILLAVFDDLYDELHATVVQSFSSEQAAGRPFRAVLQDFIRGLFTFFESRQDVFLLFVKEAYWLLLSENPDKAAYFMRQRDRVVHAVVPALESAMARGEVRSLPAEAVAHLILGNVKGLQMHFCLDREAHADGACTDVPLARPEGAAAFLTTLLLDGLLVDPASALHSQPSDA